MDPESKLSKYAPKNWRSSHTYVSERKKKDNKNIQRQVVGHEIHTHIRIACTLNVRLCIRIYIYVWDDISKSALHLFGSTLDMLLHPSSFTCGH